MVVMETKRNTTINVESDYEESTNVDCDFEECQQCIKLQNEVALKDNR